MLDFVDFDDLKHITRVANQDVQPTPFARGRLLGQLPAGEPLVDLPECGPRVAIVLSGRPYQPTRALLVRQDSVAEDLGGQPADERLRPFPG
jgi:hypothetical protein